VAEERTATGTASSWQHALAQLGIGAGGRRRHAVVQRDRLDASRISALPLQGPPVAEVDLGEQLLHGCAASWC
jgi:hypothetical protein